MKPFNKRFILDSFVYGFLLWFFGYVLGFVFFAIVSPDLLGYVIMPFGVLVTLWVLFKRIKAIKLEYYLSIAIVWTVIAILLDYVFVVQLLKPIGGYYKFDVYSYYLLTFFLPLMVGYLKSHKTE